MGRVRRALRGGLPGLLLPPLLVLTALAYWPGLGGPLVLDDLTNLEVLTAFEAGDATAADVITGYGEHPFQRPVAMASFLANQVAQGASVPALKYTNLMIHLLCGALLFWLAGRLFRQPAVAAGDQAWWLALWTAALWLSAPMLVSTVLYTVQRMAQLAALFALAGLLLYVTGRERLSRHPRSGWAMIGVALAVCWPLATLSKENGVLLPLLMLVLEMFFLRWAGLPDRVRRIRPLPVITLVAMAGAGFLLANRDWLLAGYQARDFGLLERVYTQSRVMVDYVLNLLSLPGASPLGIYRDDFAVLDAPFRPPFPGLLLAGWLAVAVSAWRLRRHPAGPALGGLMFFMAGHLVESTILPLEIYFEHRNYLPAAGLFLGIAAAVPGVTARLPRWRRPLAVAMAAMVAMNLLLTAARVNIWRTKDALLAYHLETHPGSVRAHAAAANLALSRADFDAALAAVNAAATAARGSRDETGAGIHRLAIRCRAQRDIGSTAWSRLVLSDAPYTVSALGWLVDAIEQGACPDFPVANFLAHLERQPRLKDLQRAWDLLLFKARLALVAGDERAAAGYFMDAYDLRPRRPVPALRAAMLFAARGDQQRVGRILEDLASARPAWPSGLQDAYRRLEAGVAPPPLGLESGTPRPPHTKPEPEP